MTCRTNSYSGLTALLRTRVCSTRSNRSRCSDGRAGLPPVRGAEHIAAHGRIYPVEIVLRESPDGSQRRLVLKVSAVDDAPTPGATLSATFVYQHRRRRDEDWAEDNFNLATLKAGQEVRMELHSAETLKIFEELGRLYAATGSGVVRKLLGDGHGSRAGRRGGLARSRGANRGTPRSGGAKHLRDDRTNAARPRDMGRARWRSTVSVRWILPSSRSTYPRIRPRGTRGTGRRSSGAHFVDLRSRSGLHLPRR